MRGVITDFDERYIYIAIPFDPTIAKQNITEVEVQLHDGRSVSPQQRVKIWALVAEIAKHVGDERESIHHNLMTIFCVSEGMKLFSISTNKVNDSGYRQADMTTAKKYIDFLISFCLENGISSADNLMSKTEDIGKYLYNCLTHRKCCVCGKEAEFHHATGYRVGMGRNRKEVPLLGVKGYALCRVHHEEAHRSERDFNNKYHVYPVKLDEVIVNRWNDRR